MYLWWLALAAFIMHSLWCQFKIHSNSKSFFSFFRRLLQFLLRSLLLNCGHFISIFAFNCVRRCTRWMTTMKLKTFDLHSTRWCSALVLFMATINKNNRVLLYNGNRELGWQWDNEQKVVSMQLPETKPKKKNKTRAKCTKDYCGFIETIIEMLCVSLAMCGSRRRRNYTRIYFTQ